MNSRHPKGYLPGRIPSRPIQGSRSHPCWGYPCPVDKLLHLRKREADYRPTVQQWRRELLCPLDCRRTGGHRDRNRHKPNLGGKNPITVNGEPRECYAIDNQQISRL